MTPATLVSKPTSCIRPSNPEGQILHADKEKEERLSEAAISLNGRNKSVFSKERDIPRLPIKVPKNLKLNCRNKMEGQKFLKLLPAEAVPIVFFDPQYRGILDKMKYGNEGKTRGRERNKLPQMQEDVIQSFIKEADRILIPSGHLFLWVDKFHLCQGVTPWLADTNLQLVDMIVWNKMRIGMGYRTRRKSEYLVVFQTKPKRAKGVWQVHTIPDVWEEKLSSARSHVHEKPIKLQMKLIESVSSPGDVIVDPAAGSFSVMAAAITAGRNFLGCDING